MFKDSNLNVVLNKATDCLLQPDKLISSLLLFEWLEFFELLNLSFGVWFFVLFVFFPQSISV